MPNCVFQIWKLFDGKIPEWYCYEPTNYGKVVPVESSFEISPEILIPYTLFIFGVGLFGATLTEWLNNKLEWIIDPLGKKIQKRYSFVVERNRLKTMNGHP